MASPSSGSSASGSGNGSRPAQGGNEGGSGGPGRSSQEPSASSPSAAAASAAPSQLPPQTPTPSSASALAIPTPSHLSIAIGSSGGLSPISRHPRSTFDSTPSFSSPLAYASTLPSENAEDLDLDTPMAVDGNDASRTATPSSRSSLRAHVASSPPLSFRSFSITNKRSPQSEAFATHNDDTQPTSLDTPLSSGAATARRERSTSARTRLLAWDKQDAGHRASANSSPTIRSETSTRRKSNAGTTLMGPPLTIPRKVSTTSTGGRQEPEASIRSGPSSRLSSGMSDDSQRSVSTSSVSSTEAPTSPLIPWQSTAEASPSATPTSVPMTATPSGRTRSSTQGSTASAHRRAKSLGGSLLEDLASPIGGPDGVDPDLVAAIRASDPSMLGQSSSGLESSLSRMTLSPGDHHHRTLSVSPASRIGSLPSTPIGSVRMSTSHRKSSDQSESVPDSAPPGSNFHTLQIPHGDDGQGGGAAMSPTLARMSQDYSRTRVRSQTLVPASPDPTTLSASGLSSSFGPSSTLSQYVNRSSAPLGEAIRLQKMPNSIRMAGDVYNRNETSNRNAAPTSSSYASPSGNSSSGHGLGIGMSEGRLASQPHTPSLVRSHSPMTMSDLTSSSSPSSSGRNSPVLPRKREVIGSQSHDESGTSPLSVYIPEFENVNVGPLSAMPAFNYDQAEAPSPSTRSTSVMGPPPSGQLSASQNAFAPVLAMPSAHLTPAKRTVQRSSSGTIYVETPDLNLSADVSHRPAPWIASSQDVERGTSKRTLKAALTQRGRASMTTTSGSGQFSVSQGRPVRVNSIKGKEPRRISAASTQSGIDDYARIIIQSRNAKMQKWRTMSKQPGEGNDRDALGRRMTLGGEGSTTATKLLVPPQPSGGAAMLRASSEDDKNAAMKNVTPNVSPAASDNTHEAHVQQMGQGVGSREIEWVDWLDEYRKMKEVKVRTEREEVETKVKEEEEAEVSVELEAVPPSPMTASPMPLQTSPTVSRSSLPSSASPAGYSPNLSSSMGIADGKRGQRPRRPSEMPRFTARQDPYKANRRSSSNALMPSSPAYRDDGSPVLDRRSTLLADKSRTLSLSPITSRVTSSTSQQSSGTYAGAIGSGRRKKMLGGKIEAWWGAVKSGFTGAPPSNATPSSSYNATPVQSQSSTRYKEPQPELSSIFTSQDYGAAHNRSNTLHMSTSKASEAKSVHTLRAASSAQNLRSEEPNAVPSSDGPSITSTTSSTGTALASGAPQATTAEGRASPASLQVDEANKFSRPVRKGTHLSLHLDKGLSAFDAGPFERMGTDSPHQIATPPSRGESSKSSPRERNADAAGLSKTRGGSKTLSDAWRPEIVPEEKSRSVSATSSQRRGRTSQRRTEGESDASKDMTINSIRQHIHNRLAASKEVCDREVKKVILSINAFVEETLQEKDEEIESIAVEAESDMDTQGAVFDDDTDLDSPMELLALEDVDPLSQSTATVAASAPVRQQQQQQATTPDERGIVLQDASGEERATPRRRESTFEAAEEEKYMLPPPPAARYSPLVSRPRRPSTLMRNSSHELTASRSTSRSHSPLPGALLSSSAVAANESPQYSPARRYRTLLAEDAPLEPYITALQDLVSIAMDVFDTSINALTARSGACSEIIAKVQSVGKLWDENPHWLGRGWYVQLLLAVASLSRVVEWWEAEKGFWNFDQDQGDKLDAEPIRFIFGNSAHPMLDGNEYTDVAQSNATRSGVSTSPSRIRHPVLQHISQTPSQHSSGASSPALEPWKEGGKRAAGSESMDDAVGTAGAEVVGEAAGVAPTGSAPAEESQNILMELSLDGERFLYVSPAWRKVIGSDPADIFDTPIEDILAPGDASTFAQATEQLQVNDSHTVEAAFRLQVCREGEANEKGVVYYQEMEGKGMLMHDRQSAMPSHTMWVFKPVGAPEAERDLAPGQQRPAAGAGEPPVINDGAALASNRILISTEPLLCRICERDVPTWFFEKHSEICNETHRLDMEISEYNEGIAELRRVTRSLINALEEGEGKEVVEYRSIPLTTPPVSHGPPSALEVANRSILPRQPNPAAIRKLHLRALDDIMDTLRTAGTISTPAVKEDTASDPIEKQRLLSPESESKIVQVKNWRPVLCDDAALEMLIVDVQTAVRSKLSAVNRMLNTIVYVETVRMEWEGRVEAALAEVREETESGSSSVEDNEAEQTALPPSPAEEDSPGDVTMTAASGGDDDLEDNNTAAAVLLDTYEPDAARSNSTSLSAQLDTPGDQEDDIPGVESHMGGSILDTSPIPIPSGPSPSRTTRQRRMMRDASSASSMGVDSVTGPPRLDAFSPHSRRESAFFSGERATAANTPPLSPRHSPADLSSFRPKDRRISVTQRSGLHSPHLGGTTPLSPRLPPTAPSSRPTASSINDFDIIKPISKGAFGSVFLTKKRTTGDYYAIKVLKKSDMIAKNQITNVKAERMILMTQTQSPFVVKLFFTFQSSEYLYLVMEYLPGGDCASLCKALGGLPEEWAKQYVAEVVNGLESLHSKGVVHRDMKPDNLLIDQKGHLKLTDFGLSKIGLLGRQNRQQMGTSIRSTQGTPNEGHAKRDSTSSNASPSASAPGPVTTPAASGLPNPSLSPVQVRSPNAITPRLPETPLSLNIAHNQNFFVGMPPSARGRIMSTSTDASDSSGAESPRISAAKPVPAALSSSLLDSPSHIFGSHVLAESMSSGAAARSSGGGSGAQVKKFVGTPDYLAPESILGLGMDDAAVDWWALGVILYEFLYGYPPFHADTPEKVFDNIISRKIEWDDEEETQFSSHARDLMEQLMCTDRKHRLGAGENGAADIKRHPFFEGIDWDNLTKIDGPFVPQITNAESTDYFDLRGAVYQEFSQEQAKEAAKAPSHGFNREFAKALEGKRSIEPGRPPSRYRMRLDRNKTQDSSLGGADEFGSFSYKNLPVLKQANDEVIKKMRGDQLNSMSSAMIDQTAHHHRHRSISGRVTTPGQRNSMAVILPGVLAGGPPSPSTSVSSQSSVPSKSTAPTSPSGAPLGHLPSLHHHLTNQHHRRRPSELSSAGGGMAGSPSGMSSAGGTSMMERKRSQLNESDNGSRRSSLPSRKRTSSLTGAADRSTSLWNQQQVQGEPSSAGSSGAMMTGIVDSTSSERAERSTAQSTEAVTSATMNPSSDQITCLIAEDNPISLKMLENILVKLGCVVSSVRNGAEALRLAMAETKFAVLFIDVTLPIVNGQDVARMIKSTRNINSVTPVIALASIDDGPLDGMGSVFDAVLAKPIEKADVCNILPRFGFKPLIITTRAGSGGNGAAEGASARRGTVAGLERVEGRTDEEQ